MRLIYHPDAEAELIEAAQYYEGQVPPWGRSFLTVWTRDPRYTENSRTLALYRCHTCGAILYQTRRSPQPRDGKAKIELGENES